MAWRSIAWTWAAAAGMLVGTGTTGVAQERTAQARLEVRATATSRSGATEVPSASSGGELEVGETKVFGLQVSNFDGGIGSGGWPLWDDTALCAWRVKATLLAVQSDTIEVAVSWSRHQPQARAGNPAPGDTRVIRLNQGQRHVLDLVHSDSPDSKLANVVVDIEAQRVEDPAFKGMAIGYDVWLVHESKAGTKTTRQVKVEGGQGEKRAISFRPIFFGLDGSPQEDGVIGSVSLSGAGSVVGRLSPDGTIEVSVVTKVFLACGRGRTGGEGWKSYWARDGETTAIELPTSFGWCTLDGVHDLPPGARTGVTATPVGLRISSREFFEGDRLSLLVRVRRMR